MHDKDNQPPTETDQDPRTRLTADALGQLDDQERGLLEVDLRRDADARGAHEELSRVADALSRQHAAEPLPAPSGELRGAIEQQCRGEVHLPPKPVAGSWSRRRVAVALTLAACGLVLLAIPIRQAWLTRQTNYRAELARSDVFVKQSAGVVKVQTRPESEIQSQSMSRNSVVDDLADAVIIDQFGDQPIDQSGVTALDEGSKRATPYSIVTTGPTTPPSHSASTAPAPSAGVDLGLGVAFEVNGPQVVQTDPQASDSKRQVLWRTLSEQQKEQLRSATVTGRGRNFGLANRSSLSVVAGGTAATPQFVPQSQAVTSGSTAYFRSGLPDATSAPVVNFETWAGYGRRGKAIAGANDGLTPPGDAPPQDEQALLERILLTERLSQASGERYQAIVENRFVPVSQQALSTFSIDVDTASYANVRRFLAQKKLPPANAVRIEELINYFSFNYPAPEDDRPFAAHLEVTECPWQPKHRIVRIGLQGRTIARPERPGCNLVFLLDVSGSMKDANKLPLLKRAMKMLVDQLGENDRVAIVTYASQAGVRLKSTVADKHDVIRDAIDGLNANGSTNGGAGIELAYEQALAGAIEGGINRVILATDGDLNVGITDDDALVRLIKEKAADDVFLTVLGFGEGNLQDAKLEKLADNGNGFYAYIDNLREARKVLVEQIEGSLVTIAKDVKIKVEFNPAEVLAYRLIGYENRLMTVQEFDDDKKDAGEIGAGHSVTALYELVPAAPGELASAESLKYQQPAPPTVPEEQLTDAARSGELLTLSLRYKLPDSHESTLQEVPLLNSRKRFSEASADLRFATAVASFGMLLRDSAYRGDTSFEAVEEIAAAATGEDQRGYRTEFLDLVRQASALK